ncbi:MAG: IS3 family transposase, partial [Nitrospira sp.]|nr:IS3 family transposase [Nitrospira sp.]
MSRPHTRVVAHGTRRACAAEARKRDTEAGARFFKTCGGVLREGVAMRYRVIQEHDRRYPIRLMCRALAVSAAGYYAWRSRPESARSIQTRLLRSAIRVIHHESRDTYGSPRIGNTLVKQGHHIGEHRVARLMRQDGMRAQTVKKGRATTQSNHRLPVAANTLERAFRVEAPNRVWAGDLTYVWTLEGWLYVAVLLDLYSRRVVGWAMGQRLTVELAEQALTMAVANRAPAAGLVHHSDRGSQGAFKWSLQRPLELVIPRSLLRGSGSLVPSGAWRIRGTMRFARGRT